MSLPVGSRVLTHTIDFMSRCDMDKLGLGKAYLLRLSVAEGGER